MRTNSVSAFSSTLPVPVFAPPVLAGQHLRWTFRRGARALTCEVTLATAPGASCEVKVIPEWNAAAAHVEPTVTAMSALCRHAEIASRLREAGWSLVSRA